MSAAESTDKIRRFSRALWGIASVVSVAAGLAAFWIRYEVGVFREQIVRAVWEQAVLGEMERASGCGQSTLTFRTHSIEGQPNRTFTYRRADPKNARTADQVIDELATYVPVNVNGNFLWYDTDCAAPPSGILLWAPANPGTNPADRTRIVQIYVRENWAETGTLNSILPGK